ncbi:methyl-accepting chemotaxis protein [Paraburkholderia acidisoli]|uniref:HAMP domain-containing protein n=1 Tax=Paraburkholderia acidisoli TaxID=2571748 RepID=A0A7Z2GRK2_9BURK|nr:methyl-accepting chemotaxis protein [Paraburkholderia acidisoli]QGZ66618.1 HAMP domain-containing protein [Paraburkholderia acidisoli]
MRLSIQSRLALTMSLLSALLLAVGLFGIAGMTYSNDGNLDTYTNKLPSANFIGEAELSLQRERTALLRGAIDTSSDKNIRDTVEHEQAFRAMARTALAGYMKLPQSKAEAELARDLLVQRAAMDQGLDAFAQALVSKDGPRIMRAALDNNTLYGRYHASSVKLRELQVKEAREAFETGQYWYGVLRVVTFAALALGLLTAVGSFLGLRRAIARPLGDALAHFERIAQGDLTRTVPITSQDEMGRLQHGIADMQARLRQTVRDLRQGSDAIALATSEVAAGNQDLSARTEEQAAALEETAASMEELTSTVKHNTDNAQQARQLAATARDVTLAGSRLVQEVVQTMSGISESAVKIADITGMIEGIAFQTNILALNAAVEAARAGENGRGFAVVASEVRSLAQRSSAAAKEIKDLIGASVERVRTGHELVVRNGNSMEQINLSIQRVYDIVGEIATASHEQSRGIEQVNQAISQMDGVTQQNAALVEQAAAAAMSLEDQAARLRDIVNGFRTDESYAHERGDHAGVSTTAASSSFDVARARSMPAMASAGMARL